VSISARAYQSRASVQRRRRGLNIEIRSRRWPSTGLRNGSGCCAASSRRGAGGVRTQTARRPIGARASASTGITSSRSRTAALSSTRRTSFCAARAVTGERRPKRNARAGGRSNFLQGEASTALGLIGADFFCTPNHLKSSFDYLEFKMTKPIYLPESASTDLFDDPIPPDQGRRGRARYLIHRGTLVNSMPCELRDGPSGRLPKRSASAFQLSADIILRA
jgi:hypothetical protein